MSNSKIKITIEIDKIDYLRIQEIVQHRNLMKKFTNTNYSDDILTEQDFIIGSVINYLEYVELFAQPLKHSDLIKQDERPIKNSLNHYLKKHNIKQIDLAKATGIDKSNLNSMLKNKYQPFLDSFLKIWQALDFPPLDEIFYRES